MNAVTIESSIMVEGTFRPSGRKGPKMEYAYVVHLDDVGIAAEYLRRQLAITLAALGRQGRLPSGSEIKISELEAGKRAASPEQAVRRMMAVDPEAAARLLRKIAKECGIKL